MPPRRGKRHDPDVWNPPTPLCSSTTAPGPLSAFQERFANRTEVVGKDGANAQLGVAAVSGGSHHAAVPAPLKGGGLVPLRPPTKNTSEKMTGDVVPTSQASSEPSVAVPVRRNAKKPPRLRIVAPNERGRIQSLSISSEGPQTPSPADAKRAVKYILPPSTVAAPTTAAPCATPGSKRMGSSLGPTQPLREETGLRRHPSMMSSSLSTPLTFLQTHSPCQSVSAPVTPTPVARALSNDGQLSAPRLGQRTGPTWSRQRPAMATASAASSPGKSERTQAPSKQVARLEADRSLASPPPHSTAAAPDGITPINYKPYSLRSYRALMADVAGQKMGGLGPSDTDEQRAAREKHERAKAYGRRAESVARTLLAEARLRSDKENGNPDANIISPASSSSSVGVNRRRGAVSSRLSSPSSDARSSYTTTITSSSSSASSRSPSATRPAHPKQKQRGPARVSVLPPPQATSPPLVHSRPSRVVTPQARVSAATHENGELIPPPSGTESTREKTPETVLPPLSAPARASQANINFSLVTASRRQIAQARRRRERALTYGRRVSRRRQKTSAATGSDDGGEDPAGAVSGSATSPAGRGVRGDSEGDADANGAVLGRLISASTNGILQRADVDNADRAQRRERLLELEALHAQKQKAVEMIRRKLHV